MSRGYDGPEIDDFRGSSFGWRRDADRDPSSDWNTRFAVQNIHREEDRTDRRDSEARERGDKDRPPIPREDRVRQMLSERVRTKYTDRNKQYSLRDSEINTLGEVGKFRFVGMNDLAEFAYNGDRSRMENDVQSLARQGLLQETTIADPEHNPTQVVTLTKEGNKLLSRGKVVASSQVTYHGLKKPKEAFHDADLYRLYHRVSDEIESRGGSVVRVKLDYEMKRELYERSNTETEPEQLVFPSRNGMPINPKNLLRRVLQPACRKLNLPVISWHSFRHSHATLLGEVGESLRTAQAILGHSDLKTTLNIYTHAIPESQKRAIDKVASLLFPSVPQFSGVTENGSVN